jgi:hypothetical protein
MISNKQDYWIPNLYKFAAFLLVIPAEPPNGSANAVSFSFSKKDDAMQSLSACALSSHTTKKKCSMDGFCRKAYQDTVNG